MTNIINLTPHAVNIFDSNGNQVVEIQPSGDIARIETSRELVRTEGCVEFYHTTTGALTGAPDQQQNTIYIVSGMVRSLADREDFWQPGELLRDDSGRPIGCVGLSR